MAVSPLRDGFFISMNAGWSQLKNNLLHIFRTNRKCIYYKRSAVSLAQSRVISSIFIQIFNPKKYQNEKLYDLSYPRFLPGFLRPVNNHATGCQPQLQKYQGDKINV
jgi:hypothetical protein